MNVLSMTQPKVHCHDEGVAVRAIHIERRKPVALDRESWIFQGMEDAKPANSIVRRLDLPARNRADTIRGLPEKTDIVYAVPSRDHMGEDG